MQNTYIGYHFEVEPKELGSEILIAELGELPFDSYIETEKGFSGLYTKRSLERVDFGRYLCFKQP